MIVIDANVIVYLAVRNDCVELAEAAYEKDSVWMAPRLWRSELRQALVKYMQFSGMSLDAAMLAAQTAEEFVDQRDHKVGSEKVLELAGRSKCTAYDCEYVALAMDLGVPLVTTDRQLLRAFPKVAMSLEKFVGK